MLSWKWLCVWQCGWVSGSVVNALTLTAHKSDQTAYDLLLLSVCRSEALQVVLDAASGDQADTRNKAVRLIANKLFAQTQLQDSIEKFARHMLFRLTATSPSAAASADAPALSIVKVEQPPLQTPQATAATPTEPSSDPQAPSQQQLQHQSEEEGTRLSGLYCALCTKKQPLLRDLLLVYGRAADGCKAAIEAVAAGKHASVTNALHCSGHVLHGSHSPQSCFGNLSVCPHLHHALADLCVEDVTQGLSAATAVGLHAMQV